MYYFADSLTNTRDYYDYNYQSISIVNRYITTTLPKRRFFEEVLIKLLDLDKKYGLNIK